MNLSIFGDHGEKSSLIIMMWHQKRVSKIPFSSLQGVINRRTTEECESTKIHRTLNSLTTKSPRDTLEHQPLIATTPIIDVNLLINTQLLESTLSTATMMRFFNSLLEHNFWHEINFERLALRRDQKLLCKAPPPRSLLNPFDFRNYNHECGKSFAYETNI